ncbi:MAG: alanine racemase [Gammaproteobacteria bacterium]|nr:alanine racemase [Gammaproteobacteria bacterium]
MPNTAHSHARLRIDLGALQDNYALLARAASPSGCAAVVKADGYGLGMVPVSIALQAAGCTQFFVSEVHEGVALQSALADAEIFVLAGITDENAQDCLDAGLIPVLSSDVQVAIWRRVAGSHAPAAIKVDTGMTRLGFRWDTFKSGDIAGIHVRLVMTHLACADTPEHPMNAAQLARFRAVRDALPGIPTSIGNTGGTLSGEATRGDLCRCGIGLYGGNPYANAHNPFRPVATLEGQVLQISTLASDESIGYGATFKAVRGSCVATVGIGYSNGLPRALSNIGEAYRDDETYPIVGRISMNLTTIAVTAHATLAVGDWVELIGAAKPLDDIAALAGTIGYEILTGLSAARRYSP